MDTCRILLVLTILVISVLGAYYLDKHTDYEQPEIKSMDIQNYIQVDLGYNLESNKQLWKYPNETIWRDIDG